MILIITDLNEIPESCFRCPYVISVGKEHPIICGAHYMGRDIKIDIKEERAPFCPLLDYKNLRKEESCKKSSKE